MEGGGDTVGRPPWPVALLLGDEYCPAAGRAPGVASNQRGRPRFPAPDYTESPMPRASTSGERVRFHVENGVAVPTRVHTVSKGALIMGISTRFRISTDGYEEGND